MAAQQLSSEQAILGAFEQLINERDNLSGKTIELQSELAEHDLVVRTLEPLDAGRKCFRLVGDVLVERTVGEVLPAVQKNRDNLKTVRGRGLDAGCQCWCACCAAAAGWGSLAAGGCRELRGVANGCRE